MELIDSSPKTEGLSSIDALLSGLQSAFKDWNSRKPEQDVLIREKVSLSEHLQCIIREIVAPFPETSQNYINEIII